MSGDKTPPGRDGHLAGTLQVRLSEVGTLEGRIAEIVHAVPGRIAFSTSLGLEDQAVLHAIAQAGAEIDVFTLDTGRLFPETLETLAESERRYGLRIRVVAPDAGELEAARGARRRAGLSPFPRGAQGLLRCAQGAPSEPFSQRCSRLDHRTETQPIQRPRGGSICRLGRRLRPYQGQPDRRLERGATRRLHRRQPTCRSMRCMREAIPRSAASPARARSGLARTSARDAGGGRTRTARNADCTRGRRATAGAAA